MKRRKTYSLAQKLFIINSHHNCSVNVRSKTLGVSERSLRRWEKQRIKLENTKNKILRRNLYPESKNICLT
jgi:DNA-binding transcriptional regulator YiaG